MKIYEGIIEDVNDPLKLGRVRVRVFGLHTDNKTLIPTETLPWASVLMPTTSTSMSGLGTIHGLWNGSWVTVYFKDPDNQYPVVFGSLLGIKNDVTKASPAYNSFEYSDAEGVNQNVLIDSAGTPVVDSQNQPIKTEPVAIDPKVPQETNSKVITSELGSVSSKYESSGRANAINQYITKPGLDGASYGAYQFSSYLIGDGIKSRPTVTNSDIKNSPLNVYIRTSAYKSYFDGLRPATPEFDAMWKQVAKDFPTEFLDEQHKYMEKNYYKVLVSKLPNTITMRGKAIHEAIWAMSVQRGPSLAKNRIMAAVGNVAPEVCDVNFIDMLYKSMIDNVPSDFKSSPTQWAGIYNRYPKERDDLIRLAKTYEVAGSCSGTPIEVSEQKVVYTDGKKETVDVKVITAGPAVNNTDKGFTDPEKNFPLYYNEPDTNRLTNGVITGTIVDAKRSGTISGQEAGDTTISEPVTQYNTKYPYNKVFATRSGHIIELDDTPGYERIHVYHKSGTFVEFYPDGKLVTKVRDTNTTVVNLDNNTITMGDSNIHTEGNSNETVYGNKKLIVYGNLNIEVNGDCNTTVTGNASIKASKINLN